MATAPLPIGNSSFASVSTPKDLGEVIRATRKAQGLTQAALAGIGNTGNRVIVDIENGKPTAQIQKVLDLMDLLGLELVVRQKGSRS